MRGSHVCCGLHSVRVSRISPKTGAIAVHTYALRIGCSSILNPGRCGYGRVKGIFGLVGLAGVEFEILESGRCVRFLDTSHGGVQEYDHA